jgi:hypothetical protein
MAAIGVVLGLCCCSSSSAAGGWFGGFIPGTEPHFLKEIGAPEFKKNLESLEEMWNNYKNTFLDDNLENKPDVSLKDMELAASDFNYNRCENYLQSLSNTNKNMSSYGSSQQQKIMTLSGSKRGADVLYTYLGTTHKKVSLLDAICMKKIELSDKN